VSIAMDDKTTAANLCSIYQEARNVKGIIDCTGDVPVVRRVLGTLPVTADGCVAEYGNAYWFWDIISQYNQPIKYGWTERVLESCAPHDAEYSWTTNPALCYSTLDAAKAMEER